MVVALLLASVALWGASGLTWIDVPRGLTVDGRLSEDLSGSDLMTWPVPLALLALASVAGVLGGRGVVRRILGVLLVVVGAVILYLALNGDAYDVAWSGWAPGYDDTAGVPEHTFWGPAVAVAGGVLVLLAGALLTWRGHRMPRMGAKYSAPGGRRAEKHTETDLWDALSDGEDPTTRS
ncbi:Trp biosynthesis-associated membrane protein [Prauserella cavernicola]|uniref:Trp biosynthesis-associated membrane protein n=1 Tax=Prauserella cavernicola TaxID=2800127 RepID=UPI0027DB218D|nr:Trp biosynthesis-associated membrane protein [Prauserella cavernicola]